MKVEARLFELLTGFFFFMAVVYGVVTAYSRVGMEWVGVTAITLTGGLTLITGTFLRFIARRIELRPEDRVDAEVAEGAGELGFFSPGSWWPILIAGSAGIVAVALAMDLFWLLAAGAACVIATVAGLVFEYHRGPEKH
ncbi:Cytochrome-c oxidase [Segniliparus rotundus DSM 44985]|uniref:Cytochrome c oxidase polypeptide 4 n=1 Tax=Segniliparus rotundus (strain ATCC BAA-972 / CDC 1076 / CIP 108378 / DSM 44985 / JCM 13578) TaxID=640132 RepID=D6ZF06_SEGRD|nr:cytochrome c oxidase subunit 4 [Segniliparus rotundus]ADG97530.1 Cytochrome-c oxidase [Segniliparus rotundus DSM 44985]